MKLSFNELDPIGTLCASIREAISLWDHKSDDVYPVINFQLGEWRQILKVLEEEHPDAI